MLQPRFDGLSERLLHAGIAPRHVRRYVGELHDHFDDLVREETAAGLARHAAEASALSRLGREDDLADVMLAHPGLRSMASRFPWAVFGLGSGAMIVAALATGIAVEGTVLDLVSTGIHAGGWKATPGDLRAFTLGVEAWNALIIYVAPVVIAALLYVIGVRQRVSRVWILFGVAAACLLGGFQELSWYDTGSHGELTLTSGLVPPFPNFLAGVGHAAANFALVAAAWWLVSRRARKELA
jgi:hypothetical protein